MSFLDRTRASVVIARTLQLADRHQAETITSRNFAPIDLREGNGSEEYGPGPLAEAVSNIASWLGEFEHGGGRPFWSVCAELYRLTADVPTTPEELRRSDWSERLDHLLQQVEQDIAQESWGLSSCFSSLHERIENVRTLLKRTEQEWSVDAEFGCETAVLILVGEEPEIDRYVQAIGAQLREVRKDAEPSDEVVTDPPHSAAPAGLQSEAPARVELFGTPYLEIYGQARSPKVVQLCEPLPLPDLESFPRLEEMLDALHRVVGGLATLPGQQFAALLTAIFELIEENKDDFVETLRRKGPPLAHRLGDARRDLDDSQAAIPDSAKKLLLQALEEAACEFAKCENIPARAQRNVSVRLVAVSAIGPRAAIRSKLTEAISIDESRFPIVAEQGVDESQPVAV